jgi:hypothetical protein
MTLTTVGRILNHALSGSCGVGRGLIFQDSFGSLNVSWFTRRVFATGLLACAVPGTFPLELSLSTGNWGLIGRARGKPGSKPANRALVSVR